MTRLAAGLVLCLIAATMPLSAQTRGTERWEIDFHVGGAFVATPADGEGSLPGGSRVTTAGAPDMWQVPSWYFGDGASVLAQFPLPRTTPLDSMLQSVIARQESSATYGARIARRLTDRLGVEGNIDFSRGARELTASARAALEASSTSFVSYWRTFPSISPSTVTSSVEVQDGDLFDVLTTGVLTWDFAPQGRITPYVVAGAGVWWTSGDGPGADVTGSYSTFVGNIRETDSLTIRHRQSSRTGVGVFGGGVRWPLGPRWGVRIDVRDHVSGSGVTTELDATPSSSLDSTAAIIVINPGLTTAIRLGRSAVGPPTLNVNVQGAETFQPEGVRHRVNVTAGLTWRF